MATALEIYRQDTSSYSSRAMIVDLLIMHSEVHGSCLGNAYRSGTSIIFSIGEYQCEARVILYYNSSVSLRLSVGDKYDKHIITSIGEAIEDICTIVTEQGL